MNPVQAAEDEAFHPAPRLRTIDGKILGLYSNDKLNATKLLDMVADILALDASFEIHRGRYSPANLMDPGAWGDIDRCDAVILANGDCGACSSSGIANAVEVEKRGIPALLISTPPFAHACTTMASLSGMPDLQWATVEHPIGSVDAQELSGRAESAAAQFWSVIVAQDQGVAPRKAALSR
jgi:hypothetical protein